MAYFLITGAISYTKAFMLNFETPPLNIEIALRMYLHVVRYHNLSHPFGYAITVDLHGRSLSLGRDQFVGPKTPRNAHLPTSPAHTCERAQILQD